MESNLHNQTQKQISKYNKKRLTQEQVSLLETSFTTNKKLEPELKLQLASQLGVPARQVAIWYQNKRARWRTQSLEIDYSTLQVRLENALAEKKRLEKDVKHLQEELRKAQEMLFGNFNQSSSQYYDNSNNYYHNQVDANSNFVSNNCSNYSNSERGSSSLQYENVSDEEVLQIDQELYACLVGADHGSTWG